MGTIKHKVFSSYNNYGIACCAVDISDNYKNNYKKLTLGSYIKAGFYDLRYYNDRYKLALPHIYIVTSFTDNDWDGPTFIYCSHTKIRRLNDRLYTFPFPNIDADYGIICTHFQSTDGETPRQHMRRFTFDFFKWFI